jgi:phage-related protein
MPKTQAIYYRDKRGREPVDDFINSLSPKAAAKIDAAIEEHLNGRDPAAPPAEYPATSQVDGNLRELRVRFANTYYRVLYERSQNLMMLLHAIEKDTARIPEADKTLAKNRMADFKSRMNAKPRAKPRAAGRDAPGSRGPKS